MRHCWNNKARVWVIKIFSYQVAGSRLLVFFKGQLRWKVSFYSILAPRVTKNKDGGNSDFFTFFDNC